MNEKIKNILNVILGILYIFLLIFCIGGFFDIIRTLFIYRISAFSVMLFSILINININKLFDLKNTSQKIAYNVAIYLIFLIFSIVLYFLLNYEILKFLPILQIIISLISLIKDKDVKRPLISMFVFDIGILLGSLW